MDPKDFEKIVEELSSLEDLIERALFAINDVNQRKYWCTYALTTRDLGHEMYYLNKTPLYVVIK